MDLDVHGSSKKAMTTLKHQAAKGVKWAAISRAGRLGAQFLTTAILARLLSPDDFGLVGMALVVLGFLNIFKDLGTSAAIIQRKEIEDPLISSIFWLNVGFGAVATTILFAGAPLIAWFYHEPRLTSVMQVFATTFILSGLGIVQNALLQRSLAFNKLAKIELTAIIFGSTLGITLAAMGAGVWSLVIQTISTVFLTTVFLWLQSNWRPKLKFDWTELKTILSYSLNLTGFNILNFLSRNTDYLLIGRYLGATALGYYTLAYQILLFPVQNISAVVSKVMFPVYSKIQTDNAYFSRVYLDVASTIAFFTFPLMMGAFLLAHPLVSVIFGEKWAQSAFLIQILAPVGAIQSIAATVGLIYQAKGKTDWLLRWGIFSVSIVIVAFLVGIRYGLIGVALAYSGAIMLLTYPSFAIPFRLIKLKFLDLVEVLKLHLLNTLAMGLIIYTYLIFFSSHFSEVINLTLAVTLGATAYLVSNYMINRQQLIDLTVKAKLLF